ncbi:hypothetical protein AB6A40_011034 [Gnathostoma spinigerum]|uniref:Uncharacterized protein n=1 Tax=Gnathostoma spinigerum TaxID=75299 RepID=A0ABD6EXZ5_9BILA
MIFDHYKASSPGNDGSNNQENLRSLRLLHSVRSIGVTEIDYLLFDNDIKPSLEEIGEQTPIILAKPTATYDCSQGEVLYFSSIKIQALIIISLRMVYIRKSGRIH